ncbi:MAG: hypothetical protein JJE47_16800 [Acidimicrobiia bacterium]|nr:hypothetical protein [Acidimicrobiia bacterium]
MNINTTRRLAVLLAALMMIAAACSSADSDDPAQVPVNDQPNDNPVASGACTIDEPNCNDTVIGGEPQVLPGDNSDAGSSGGMTVDGGLSVSDALSGGVSGVLAVQGFIVDDGTGAKLCEALAESFPPQCAGASMPISGYETAITTPFINEQNVMWTDQTVSLFGEIVDGTFVVSSAVSG